MPQSVCPSAPGYAGKPHLPISMTLQGDHLPFLRSNHSRPIAATINTATTDHGVDEVVPSLAATDFIVAFFLMSGGMV